MKAPIAALAVLCAVALLPGCPDTGIVCSAGTVRCGQGCIDPDADSKNCGSCGNSCRSGQVCVGGGCVCNTGTFPCDGECVVRQTDPKHCGACGVRCAPNDVCESSTCKTSCPLSGANTRCGSSCANLNTDPNQCGACGVVCENSQSCRGGRCTYDLVAACFSSGQVVGLQTVSELRGPLEPLGTAPAALASYGGVLLSADGIDQRLYQARLAAVGGRAFAQLPVSNVTGSVPNQVLVDPPYVYIANAGSGTLQVLQNLGTTLEDGGTLTDGGFALTTIKELALGANTYPQGMAKVGNALWVPLYGGFGATGAAAGQKVLKIDITNPLDAGVTATVSLSGIDLKPFDGGTPVARPYAITAHRGAVYVALNNLNPDTYAPEGPGMLARIDVTTNALSLINLGADKCLNPGWLASDGTRLLVSCIGAAVYSGPPSFALLRTEKSGVVLLDQNDLRQSAWEPTCPAAADGGPGCAPILPSRFAVTGGRAYVGDQNGGRIFVLDIVGSSLVERRGYFGDAGTVITACAPDPITGIANVSDVIAIP